ncbi:hypothetical protein SDC9_138397 [bioreactor metagenome]|uniref:Uncharacterized protein n=1 Tax=bioreactor metagenome TaxID=1076179 RepID=A0A645DPW1_9ZZZZ
MHTEHPFHVLARKLSDLAQHFAVFADDNALMTVAFAVDGRPYVDDSAFAADLHFVYINTYAMRHFLFKQLQRLFAYKLGAYDAFGLVGDHIVREVFGTFDKMPA